MDLFLSRPSESEDHGHGPPPSFFLESYLWSFSLYLLKLDYRLFIAELQGALICSGSNAYPVHFQQELGIPENCACFVGHLVVGNLWLVIDSLSTALLIEASWFSVPEAEVFNGSQNNQSPYATLNNFVG